jgi:basic amino acid/polyamine antiporter, APA family
MDETPPRSLFGRALFRYSRKKSPEEVISDSNDPHKSLKKSLSALDLTILGVGCIIGAGIFVYAGLGAQIAGPNIIWSFVLVGVVCGLAGLAYAEMAASIPTSGSGYAYSYTSLGETVAWTLGWALVLEYAIGSSAVAIGWSGNFTALLKSAFNVELPTRITTSFATDPSNGFINLPAMVLVLLITAVLVVGAKESARLTGLFVITKVAILFVVIGLGVFYINGSNLAIPAPPSPSSAWYSALGGVGPILAGGAIIFFAYIGFDAVSTTAEEAKNPKRDLPIGILGSLLICTLLYILASLVLLGMIPYTALSPGNGVDAATAGQRLAEPFGYAFESNGLVWAANLIRFGAIIGITSVVMVLLMGGPRVFFALARDGLLPPSWAKVHPRFGTPARATIGTGISVALVAGFGTLQFAGQITNIGTLYAFALVCLGVIVLRYARPDLARPFKVPLNIGRFPILALLGMLTCVGLMASLAVGTILVFLAWMGIGLVIYSLYGIRKSRLFGHVGRVEESTGERAKAVPVSAGK